MAGLVDRTTRNRAQPFRPGVSSSWQETCRRIGSVTREPAALEWLDKVVQGASELKGGGKQKKRQSSSSLRDRGFQGPDRTGCPAKEEEGGG